MFTNTGNVARLWISCNQRSRHFVELNIPVGRLEISTLCSYNMTLIIESLWNACYSAPLQKGHMTSIGRTLGCKGHRVHLATVANNGFLIVHTFLMSSRCHWAQGQYFSISIDAGDLYLVFSKWNYSFFISKVWHESWYMLSHFLSSWISLIKYSLHCFEAFANMHQFSVLSDHWIAPSNAKHLTTMQTLVLSREMNQPLSSRCSVCLL